MPISKLENAGLSFRDYLGYFFPGSFLLLGIVIIRPQLLDIVSHEPAIYIIMAMVGSYFGGFISHTMASALIVPVVSKIKGSPQKELLRPKKPWVKKALGEAFRKQLIQSLQTYWGDQLIQGRESDILFLCKRQIELIQPDALVYANRCVSMYTLSRSFMIPCLFNAIVFILIKNYAFALLFIVSFIILTRAHSIWMREHAKNVYRTWYAMIKNGWDNKINAKCNGSL